MALKAHCKVRWDRLQVRVGLTASVSRYTGSTTDIYCAADIGTQWAPTAASLLDGFKLRLLTNTGNGSTVSPSAVVLFDFPLLVTGTQTYTVASAFTGSFSALLEFDNWRVYFRSNGTWRLKFDAVRLYVNGSVVWSAGATTLDNTVYDAPTGIPLWGILPRASAGAYYNPEEAYGVPAAVCSAVALQTDRGDAACDSDTGWRYRETAGGAWITPPVYVSLPAIPAQACDASAPAATAPTATTTWGAGVSGYVERRYEVTDRGIVECDCPPDQTTLVKSQHRIFDLDFQRDRASNEVLLVPDLTKAVRRWNSTYYRALIFRWGFPYTKEYSYSLCRDWFSGGEDPDSETLVDSESEVHASLTQFLESVTNTTATIEAPFAYRSVAPAAMSGVEFRGQKSCAVLVRPASCSLGEPDSEVACWSTVDAADEQVTASSFPSLVEDSISNPDIANWLDHDDPVARYLNTVCAPHLAFGYWFPPDTLDTDLDGIPDQQLQWLVDGGPIASRYWLDTRYQWDYQTSLPAPTSRRMALVSPPLSIGLLSLFWKSRFGTETSPWGVSGFVADNAPAALSSLTLSSASSGAWTFTDCSGSFGVSGITLTPDPGKTTIVAKLSLGRFAAQDFLFAHLCDRITVDWSLAHVVAAAVSLVGSSGTVKVQVTAPDTFRRVVGNDDKYAGSYKQDYGAGYITTDEGSDSLPSGVSASYMGDAERVFAFGLLAGYGAEELRFTFQVDDPANTVLLEYPTFLRPSSHALYHENGNHSDVVSARGPGVRWGNHAHYYSGALHATPAVYPIGVPPLGWKSSALDWLCFRRQALEAAVYDSGLYAELQTLFDSEEADQATAAEMYESIDSGTISFLAPYSGSAFPRGIMVNSLEYPPIPHLPIGARDPATMQPTGVPAQEAWSQAEERRVYVGNGATHLFDGATQWTSTEVSPVGWVITSHLHALSNDEGSGFLLKRGSTEIAQASPYHGYFTVRANAGGGLGDAGVHLDLAQHGLLVEPKATLDGLMVTVYNVDGWSEEHEISGDVPDNVVQVACSPDGSFYVVFDLGGSVYISRSNSTGDLWSVPEVILTGTHPAPASEKGKDGLEAIAVYDGGTWKCYVRLAETEAFTLRGSIASIGTPYPSGLEWAPHAGRPLVFTTSNGTDILRYKSSDLGEP